jgi:hypothetical protein
MRPVINWSNYTANGSEMKKIPNGQGRNEPNAERGNESNPDCGHERAECAMHKPTA